MASLQERTGTYRVIFRFHGEQRFMMIGKVSPGDFVYAGNQLHDATGS
ncbi:MAG TPA: hypothetical protein VGZ22_06750 [Isosphaeraceae bacterium]|jgi:hypothetical protein|nr:hypothetical protein [Isosphaeraceae bacterium]